MRIMNYSEILESLNKASSFDLYRLKSAISRQLESPERIRAIREKLYVGQEVEMFDEGENKSKLATIRKFNPTSVAITLLEDKSNWRVPYYWINIENVDVKLVNTAKKGIDKNALSIGDTVGFRSKDGYEVYGKIIRINSKTVTLTTSRGKWRVAYSLLFPIIDSSVILIVAKVLTCKYCLRLCSGYG